MRKRFVITLLICITALIAAFAFAACKDNESVADVKGKTYVFSDFSVTGDGDYTDFETQCKEDFKGKKVTFNEDGTITFDVLPESMTYTQDGDKLVITEGSDKFDGEISGDTFLFYQNEGAAKITITFKLAAK